MHWFTLQSDLHRGLISLFYIHFSLNFNVWFLPQCDISLWSTPQSDFTFWFPAFLFHCLTVWFNCFISTSVYQCLISISVWLYSLISTWVYQLLNSSVWSPWFHCLISNSLWFYFRTVCFHVSYKLVWFLFNLHFSLPQSKISLWSTPQSGFTIRSPFQSDFNVWFPLQFDLTL